MSREHAMRMLAHLQQQENSAMNDLGKFSVGRLAAQQQKAHLPTGSLGVVAVLVAALERARAEMVGRTSGSAINAVDAALRLAKGVVR